MLILTRRVSERLRLGREVTVTVLGVRGSQVRLGVNAPRNVRCTAKRSTTASRPKSERSFQHLEPADTPWHRQPP